MGNLDHMLRGGPRDDDRDPQQRASGAAFLYAQRHPAPGQWTDDPYQQSLHYTGTAFLALSRIVAAYASVVATLERRKRRDRTTFSKSTFAVVKAVSPHGGAGNDEDYAPVYDHPLARLLESPNPQETFGSLLGYMALQKGLTGEAPVWFVPNVKGQPVELYPLQRALCQPQQPSALYPEGFWRVTPYYASGTTWAYGTLGNRTAYNAILPGQEVKRLISPHPLTRLSGYSVFTACGIQMDVLEAIDKARHSHMMQGMLPGTVVYLPGLDQSGVDRVAADLQEKYAGAQKFRKPIVTGTPPGQDSGKPIVEQLTPSPVELDFKESWEQATKFVLAALDVLPTTAGITEGGGYAERYAARQEQNDRWQGGVKAAGDFFTHHLCRPWSRKPGELRCKLVLPKVVNLERDVPSVNEMIQSDSILVNEIRRLKDMKPINGGDLPPKAFAKWVEQQAMPQPEPQAPPGGSAPDAQAGADPSAAADPLAALLGGGSDGAPVSPPRPDNPAGAGSLPPRGGVAKSRSGVRPELKALLERLTTV